LQFKRFGRPGRPDAAGRNKQQPRGRGRQQARNDNRDLKRPPPQ
jgi:hypothetical protein